MNDKLYLLLYDDVLLGNDYYLHGVFDDTPEHWESINKIIARADGYKIIKGNIVKQYKYQEPENEADFIDYDE